MAKQKRAKDQASPAGGPPSTPPPEDNVPAASPEASAPEASAPETNVPEAREEVGPATETRVAWVVLACAVLGVALPLCLARFIPFVDYPDHLAQIASIAHSSDPRFAPYYELALGKSQYFSFYLPAALIAKVLSTEVGGRVVLVLTLAGLPLAVAAFLAAHKRSMIPAAAAGLVAINMQAFFGFLNFALGVTVAILGLAAHAWFVRRPTVPRAALFGLAALVCFYAHPYTYAWLAVACVVQTLCMVKTVGMRQAVTSAWGGGLAAVPSVVGLFVWLHNSQVLEHGEAGGRIDGAARVEDSHVTFTPALENLSRWQDHSFRVYTDGAGERLALLFTVAIGALLVLRIAAWAPWRPEKKGSFGLGAPEAVLALGVATYLFGPESYKLVGGINARFIVLALALLPILAPVALSTRVRLLVGGGLIGLAAYACSVHVDHFHRLDREMGDLDEALAHTAPGKKLLGLIYDNRSSELVFLPAYMHAHQYYQSRVGGMAAWGFVELPHSPVTYRPGAAPAPFPPRFEWQPDMFDWSRWGESFDYFLVRTVHGKKVPWSFRYNETVGRVESRYEGSRWHLYERVAQPGQAAQERVDPGPDQLVMNDEVVGTGDVARPGDNVQVRYEGTLMDGSHPFRVMGLSFRVGGDDAMRGLSQGVRGMRTGGKRELLVPQDQAFGSGGKEPEVPPRAGVRFEVELVGVRHP